MKKVLIPVFLFSLCFLYAQEVNLWQNIRHSSYTQENDLHIRSELISIPGSYTEFFYSQGNGWSNGELVPLTEQTFETVVPVDPYDTVFCRFRTVMEQDFEGIGDIIPGLPDSMSVMMSGYMIEDTFPPVIEQLALTAEDPAGDIPDNMPSYLDITAQYFSNSDAKIFTAITNNSNEFPTGPIWGPFNLYVSLILNPENFFDDQVFYALIYGQIPIFLNSPGLYRFSGLDFDQMDRIGDIEYIVTDNTLVKACLIDDLISDPYFGDWPNLTNSLIFAGLTMRVDTSLEVEFGDVGQISVMFFDQYIIEPFTNLLPNLTDIEVMYLDDETEVNLVYHDLNGNFPLIAELVIEGEDTYQFEPQSLNFTQPVEFSTIFPGNWSNGLVRFSDNGYEIVEYELFSSADDVTIPEPDSFFLTVYPNPFNPTLTNPTLTIETNNNRRVEESISIYNIRGRLVNSLENSRDAGYDNEYIWDGRDLQGERVSSGVYIIQYTDLDTNRKAHSRFLLLR